MATNLGIKGKVCVTGASGFIASWLIKRLLESGYHVTGTVRDPGPITITSDVATIRPISFFNVVGERFLLTDKYEPVCEFRCSATSYKKLCLFVCNKGCVTYLCVLSGTYGHKEECLCYNNWKTPDQKPKCPSTIVLH